MTAHRPSLRRPLFLPGHLGLQSDSGLGRSGTRGRRFAGHSGGDATAITRTVFVDIRPLDITLDNYTSRPGSILALPFADNSVASLSCLHVAEHIGLGRYGDPLDPLGTQKAAAELSRVLAVGGHIYFSVPVGKPRVCFNAHRIHAPQQILDFFPALRLLDFSAVDDGGTFRPHSDAGELAAANYACGLFHFTKPG